MVTGVALIDAIDHSVLDAYRTCELATLARDGTPLAWPTSPFRRPDGTLLVTTSIAFAQKAVNVRRDGRVALLFSDPTGSGHASPAQVFIRGMAACPPELTTSPAGLEEYWSMLFWRQPSSRAYTLPGIRLLTDWYYIRMLITVTPQSVTQRPAGSATRSPQALEPGSPELAESWRRAERAGLAGARELAGYQTAVLAAREADGGIALARVVPQPVDGGYAVATEDGTPLASGPASLLVHRHDDQLAGVRFALVRGRITPSAAAGEWLLRPDRLVRPAGSPLRVLRDARASATRYLRSRGLERPAVPWEAYRSLARHPADRGQG
jgi:Pyridoxamine 5'-phosphate oxidase